MDPTQISALHGLSDGVAIAVINAIVAVAVLGALGLMHKQAMDRLDKIAENIGGMEVRLEKSAHERHVDMLQKQDAMRHTVDLAIAGRAAAGRK